MTTKHQLRRQLLQWRNRVNDRERQNHAILSRVIEQEFYQRADLLLSYLGVRTEVQTLPLLTQRWETRQPTVIPVCQEDDLKLLRIFAADQLAPQSFGVLEPRKEYWERAEFQVDESEIDLALIPGVGFDLQCQRIGYGKGYFDRLLSRLPNSVIKVGLAFECQLVERIPVDAHDIPMDAVITSERIIRNPRCSAD